MIAAAILHLSISLAVFTIGKYQLFPSQVYPSGVARFASDGVFYQGQVAQLSDLLKSQGIRDWATWPAQLHVRLYSLPLALVSRWVSFNVLTIEPLNLIYYLTTLMFIFKIGERIFGYETGLAAATIVGLWPSFLLHTTQLLRDPLLILAVVVLVWCLVELIQTSFSWRRMLLLALASMIALVTIRIVRLPMWYVIVASIATAITLFAIHSIQRRRFDKAVVIYALLLIVAVLVIPKLQPFFHNQQELGRKRLIESEEWQKLPVDKQIYGRREAFNVTIPQGDDQLTVEDGSRIDTDVTLNSPGAIIRHLPRALAVGFFAPFPNMWLRMGKQVGLSGRVISGFETLFTYVIESMALFGLWWQRRNLAAWLLAVAIGLGAVALGLVVNNMGAMYRLRYPFWVLLVVLGTGGASFLWQRFHGSKSLHNVSSREISI